MTTGFPSPIRLAVLTRLPSRNDKKLRRSTAPGVRGTDVAGVEVAVVAIEGVELAVVAFVFCGAVADVLAGVGGLTNTSTVGGTVVGGAVIGGAVTGGAVVGGAVTGGAVLAGSTFVDATATATVEATVVRDSAGAVLTGAIATFRLGPFVVFFRLCVFD